MRRVEEGRERDKWREQVREDNQKIQDERRHVIVQ